MAPRSRIGVKFFTYFSCFFHRLVKGVSPNSKDTVEIHGLDQRILDWKIDVAGEADRELTCVSLPSCVVNTSHTVLQDMPNQFIKEQVGITNTLLM